MPDSHQLGFYSFCIIFLLASFSIGNWIARHDTFTLFVSFGSFFISYLFLLQKKRSFSILFSIGVLARVLLFFSLPTLSDDVYRFIWDGLLLKDGIHPFSALPRDIQLQKIPGITRELFERINSPNYFTIYPPINQGIFWLSVNISSNWLVNANVIRCILLAADIGSLFLLRKVLAQYHRPKNLAFWYFLNPLVILELTGNLHFEGIVVFFLLVGIVSFNKNRYVLAASGFGLAIGTKLLPIIYLPVLFFKGITSKTWWLAALSGIFGFLTLLPMIDETFINGMSSSLDLYFRKFEFNASIYFIAREIGYIVYGYNNIAKIGPMLSLTSLISILAISIVAWLKKWILPKAFLFILFSYILFATIIHPWYIIPLLAFGLLAGYWFPIMWSLLIFMTYAGYTKDGFELPMWIVVVEYGVVILWALIEMKKNKST